MGSAFHGATSHTAKLHRNATCTKQGLGPLLPYPLPEGVSGIHLSVPPLCSGTFRQLIGGFSAPSCLPGPSSLEKSVSKHVKS